MEQIQTKLDELISLLNDQEEVKRYKAIEKTLNKNNYIQEKMKAFKTYQQKITVYEAKHETIPALAQERYDELLDELLNIPIYNEYIHLQTEINHTLQQITSIIEKNINEK